MTTCSRLSVQVRLSGERRLFPLQASAGASCADTRRTFIACFFQNGKSFLRSLRILRDNVAGETRKQRLTRGIAGNVGGSDVAGSLTDAATARRSPRAGGRPGEERRSMRAGGTAAPLERAPPSSSFSAGGPLRQLRRVAKKTRRQPPHSKNTPQKFASRRAPEETRRPQRRTPKNSPASRVSCA